MIGNGVPIAARLNCRIASSADWGASLGGTNILSPSTIANGVVFFADGATVYGYNAATGARLWTVSGGTNSVYAGITVVDGLMFTVDWDGTVSAFAAPGAAGQSRLRRSL